MVYKQKKNQKTNNICLLNEFLHCGIFTNSIIAEECHLVYV